MKYNNGFSGKSKPFLRRGKILRILVIVIILSLLMIAIPATPALAQAPYISLNPASGTIGTWVMINGTGFTTSLGVPVWIFFGYLAPILITNAMVTVWGSFTADFNVPASATPGTNYVMVRDGASLASNLLATALFTVIITEITLSPSSGHVGEEITVSGTGFAADKDVIITFNDVNVGSARTNSVGTFTDATFTVPKSYRGSHVVTVTDASFNSATASFATTQSITISPTSGVVGDEVTVSGTGFSASKSLAIKFDTVLVGSTTTDAEGSFSGTFLVPSHASGTWKVKVSDGVNTADTDFTVSFAGSFGQTSGYVGTEVAVSGTGFIANTIITITFAGVQIGTITTDANGSFSGSFLVPSRASGTYKVKASDSVNTVDADFTVSVNAGLNPTTGSVGTPLTVTGTGFSGTVTIKYDDKQVATATAGASGTFSATFNAPVSLHGDHAIIVTDGINTIPFTFAMESEAPPIPAPLLPKADIKVEAPTYFDWEDVTDPSGVTYTLQVASDKDFTSIVLEKEGLTKSEYAITEAEKLEPAKEEAPYYWRVKAIDSASNESGWTGAGSFYTGFIFAMPQWALYALIGLGALLIGLLGFWLGRRTAYY